MSGGVRWSEAEVLAEAIGVWKDARDWMQDAHLLALPHPDPGLTALGVFSADRTRALIVALQCDTPRDAVPAPLRIRHLAGNLTVNAVCLDPAIKRFAKTQPDWPEAGTTIEADALASMGLPLPILQPGRCVAIDIRPAAADTKD